MYARTGAYVWRGFLRAGDVCAARKSAAAKPRQGECGGNTMGADPLDAVDAELALSVTCED